MKKHANVNPPIFESDPSKYPFVRPKYLYKGSMSRIVIYDAQIKKLGISLYL